MSVLAHVVLSGAMQSEPAATQALAHILNASRDMAGAIVGILREAGIEFEPGWVQAEFGHGDSRPDLTVRDDEGIARVLVENKFWAGLTEAQPVSYLGDLPEDGSGALLFIVPRSRLPSVWHELRRRCSEAGLEWEDGAGTAAITWARADRKALVITSWAYVLGELLHAALAGEHDGIRRDIFQLRALTSRMDSEAFLPIRGEELTDQAAARRLVNYSRLIEDITRQLRDKGIADTESLRTAHSYTTLGRYLRMRERFGAWLGIELEVWGEAGITPLWCCFHDNDWSGIAGRFPTVRLLFDVQYYEDVGNLYIPIHLKTGAERDRVIEDAVVQMEQIAERLLEAFPGG